MPTINVTEYIRPNGAKRTLTFSVSEEVKVKAGRLTELGYEFSQENVPGRAGPCLYIDRSDYALFCGFASSDIAASWATAIEQSYERIMERPIHNQ